MRPFLPFATLVTAVFLLGCQEQGSGPVGPEGPRPQFNKPDENGNHNHGAGAEDDEPSIVADFIAHDADFTPSSSLLVTTCPGTTTTSFSVRFGHTQCLIVRPTWTSPNFDPYDLTDDIFFSVKRLKGEIVQVQLTGQDVIGADGIMHETDKLPVDPRVPTLVPTAGNDFTFHVHMNGVAVYRLSGHLAGKRVEQIGTISIADVVYRVAP